MKPICLFLAMVLFCLSFTACGAGNEEAPPLPTEASDFVPPEVVAFDENAEPDIDLTSLSSTMVYAEVYNMMVDPESYVGKTIKARGEFYVLQNDAPDRNYYMLLIKDALACCAQGLEFFPTNNPQFPDDFPAFSSQIELTGTYTAYDRNGTTFYYLVCNQFTILEEANLEV